MFKKLFFSKEQNSHNFNIHIEKFYFTKHHKKEYFFLFVMYENMAKIIVSNKKSFSFFSHEMRKILLRCVKNSLRRAK